MTEELKPVEVTQEDREAAWPLRPSCYRDDAKTRHNWMDGVYDKLREIQAFARHRLRSQQWEDISTAPKDHALLELIVDYSGDDADHSLQDTAQYGVTIGFNGFDDTGDDRWFLAGWCWSHDHFTEGRGIPVAWRPARLHSETDGLAEKVRRQPKPPGGEGK